MNLFCSLLIPVIFFIIAYAVILLLIKNKEYCYATKLCYVIIPAVLGSSIYFVYSAYILDVYFDKKFTEYVAVLAHEIYYAIIILEFIILSFFVACVIISSCFKKATRIKYIALSGIIVLVCLCLVVLEGTKPYLDMKTESYITYTGHFEYIGDMVGSDSIKLTDDHNKKLISNLYEELHTGNYEGTVIYGKHSKRVVSFEASSPSDGSIVP